MKVFRKCLWCPKQAKEGQRLCKQCGKRHRTKQRARYLEERKPHTRTYRCTQCLKEGHNARRHKDEK